MSRLAREGRRVRGYVFFHDQDVEGAVFYGEPGDLFLSYGALAGSGADAVEVGREVRDVLRAHGLDVRWNGSIDHRIAVVGLEWKRRRFTTPPAGAP